jgi:formate/nitrite transporter
MRGIAMDYISPSEVAGIFAANGAAKSRLSIGQMLLRGALSGALLGFATTVAFTATAQGLPPIVGAIIFPVGFAMIVILGLELVTGSFAIVPAAWLAGETSLLRVGGNFVWVFIGNLAGGCLYAVMYAAVQTQFHHVPATGAAALIVAAAQAKTLGYKKLGLDGLWLAILKAALCNWMVCMGVVMGLTSRSTVGKIIACWLPIFTFFALGFEHSVVNMFIIPAGMMMGAPVSLSDWWLWNQLPVTLGNLAGGFLFVGLPMLWLRGPVRSTSARPATITIGEQLPEAQPEAMEA